MSQLARWQARLADLPNLALPTDYPRPSGEAQVEARSRRTLDSSTARALVRLALHEQEDDDEPPTPFHLLLASFLILLHRYTGDADIVVATSSPSSPSPLLLRIKLEPDDSYWSFVKRVQWVEREAEEDKIDYDTLVESLQQGESTAPLFRVRFIDETDHTQASFLQATDLTTDLTVLVTSSSSAAASAQANPATPTSLRTSVIPAISLTLSYNSLVFSGARMSYILDQLVQLVQHASINPLDPIGAISLLTPQQPAILPDPKADLEWTGFRGAITDIFSANAKAFPDRVCIVESVAPPTFGDKNILREFSYRQIDEASNVLAHELVKGGVQREEVVMVYSTRGVDLVVAVMGVLKAGATFSVIGALSDRLESCSDSMQTRRIPQRVKSYTSRWPSRVRSSCSPSPARCSLPCASLSRPRSRFDLRSLRCSSSRTAPSSARTPSQAQRTSSPTRSPSQHRRWASRSGPTRLGRSRSRRGLRESPRECEVDTSVSRTSSRGWLRRST